MRVGFTKTEAEKMAPGQTYLANCCTDMTLYGELQVAEFLGQANHAGAYTDASNKGDVEVHSLCVGKERTEEQMKNKDKATVLFCGHITKGAKDAESAAAAVSGKLEEIGETAEAVGRGDLKEHCNTIKFSKAKGGEGLTRQNPPLQCPRLQSLPTHFSSLSKRRAAMLQSSRASNEGLVVCLRNAL